ncbi:MAG: redoxin domain-containing protein [Pirellulaceae bacterium]
MLRFRSHIVILSVFLSLLFAVAAVAQETKPAEPAKPADPAKPAAATPAATPPAAATPAATTPAAATAATGPLPGHSVHAEVFNEGPRQKAYLMPGMPKIVFPVTTKVPECQQFICQGLGQVHGFWYYEAERSFRQAAALDKECGMAYWGMAMANMENQDRAKKFMAECVKHKAGLSEHELMYIDALDAYLKADNNKKKERNEAYTHALEKILYKFPDDIEARAFLALQLWKNRDSGIPITSHIAVDAVLEQVFRLDPMHPAHHYRIHLWNYTRDENALDSAAKCGQSSPGIAHMWHMPGHIYSQLKRYDDACFQQEASARVDYAHMMRDRVLPDQIHNFAHNNEWFIRNMIACGRMKDAEDLAKNMCDLPRHPKYNTLGRGGSANLGRQRLFDVLVNFELWDEVIALSNTTYLEPTDTDNEQLKRLRILGMAHFRRGEVAQGNAQLADLQKRQADEKAIQEKSVNEAGAKATAEKKPEADITKAKEEAKKKNEGKINELQKGIDELTGHQLIAGGKFKEGLELLRKSGGMDQRYLALIQFQAGEVDPSITAARNHVNNNKNEVLPLVTLVDILWRAGKKEEAKTAFGELREISGTIEPASLAGSPAFARLAPIAKELQFPDDWRVVKPPKSDVGTRPSLDSLGPFRWQPTPGAAWALKDNNGADHTLAEFQGKPVVVIFFLGHGCLHCAQQLQAFAKAKGEFDAAGLSLIAISSDDQAGLKQSIENYKDGAFPIPLLADNSLSTFKAYRCFDDFENLPLHGTFIIDGNGLVRWHDIGFQPFMEHKFVIQEAKRLLGQVSQPSAAVAATPMTPAVAPAPAPAKAN